MPASAGLALGRLWQARAPQISLTALLVVAAALRWNGLDWDQGHVFHPDERHILMVTAGLALPLPPDWSLLLSDKSPLNPHSFAYGSLPFYLLKLSAHFIAWLGSLSPLLEPLRTYSDFDHLRLIGRFLSGLFDLGSILLVYLIGCRLRDRRVGLLASAFVALSVINVQYAHFYATDTLLTFFVLATSLLSLHLLGKRPWRTAAFTGVALGLAVGTKFSAMPLLAVVGSAHLVKLSGEDHPPGSQTRLRIRLPDPALLNRGVASLAITLLVGAATFLAVEPYALIDFATFTRNLQEQNDMVRGVADLPYTRQYINTPAYWYFVQNLAVWGLGLPLGIILWVAALGGMVAALLRPRQKEIVLLAWLLPYFAITGGFHAKFLRYLIPLVPFLALFAAYALIRLKDWSQRREHKSPEPYSFVPMAGGAIDDEPVDTTEAKASHKGEEPPSGAPGDEPAAPKLPLGFEVRRALAAVPVVEPRGERRLGLISGAVNVAIAVALLGGLLYAVAFSNIYGARHTAVSGSEWIYRNVPAGSRIMTEHWEEGMPVAMVLDGIAHDPGRYKMLSFEGYQADGPAKLNHIVERLAEADYIVFFSNRLYGTIPRLPQRYPITTEYYRLLFAEMLGFRLEASFTRYASLGGITLVEDTFADPALPVLASPLLRQDTLDLNLGKADESFSVYDHPKVLIFKKHENLSRDQLREIFAPSARLPVQESGLPAAPKAAKPLLLDAEQRSAVEAGGTFRDIFDRGDLANSLPLPVWVILLGIVGILGAPIAFAAFPHLPDRGYLLGKILAILLLAWFYWIMVSLGLLPSTRAATFIALALLAIVGGAFAWRQRVAMLGHWRERKRFILFGEAVFWAAFALFLAIRLANPDLWHPARGGEKPMDLAYLMAAIKSTTFPPYDPWFAGGYLNYYYYGQIVVGTLIKLSGIVPTTAYNLVVPTLFALTAGGAFSAVAGLLAASRARLDLRVLAAATAGAAFAVLLGNLGGAVQLIDQIMHVGPPPLQSTLPGVQGLASFFSGIWQVAVQQKSITIPSDWYWASTRVLQGTINEFPFFTFLYADLHAHMIALPFSLLALGLALNAIKGRLSTEEANSARIAQPLSTRIISLMIPALAIGALTPTNSWDFPTYLALYALALLGGWYLAGRGTLPLVRTLFQVGVVAALAYLLYWPFHSNFQQWYLGVDQIKDKSDLSGYLRIHGLFLFAIISFLVLETRRHYGQTGLLRAAGIWLRWWQYLPHVIALQRRLVRHHDVREYLAAYGAAATLAAMVALHLAGMSLLALVLGLTIWTVALALPRRNSADRLFVLVLIGLGLLLSGVVELVAIKGDIGRMNTVFKFYLQIWMLWSIAAAYCLYCVSADFSRWRWRRIWSLGLALLIAGSLVYPVVGTRARVADRFDPTIPPTLDGTAYMPQATFPEQNPDTKQARELRLGNDLPAIRWLQDNVDGTPVILEGWAPLYHWGARYSIYTGLPTVIGWDWHQKQQRWGYQAQVARRLADTRAIYGSPDVEGAVALLDQYRVKYVIVGDLERAVYSAAGLAKFDAMVGRYLEVVYDNHDVKIYRRL